MCCAYVTQDVQSMCIFFFNDTATTEIYTLSLHDALPIFEYGQEGLLRHLDAPDLLHALLALLLALEELALAGDVAAVALGRDVLAEGLDGLAGDDVRADRRLDRHVELLARDLLAELLGERPAGRVRLVAVDDHRERVDRVAAQQDVQAHHVRRPHAADLV